MISISKAEHLPSFSNRGPGELGNGLLHNHYIISIIILLSNIVLNQSVREESLIYCKNWLIDSLASDFLSPIKHRHKQKNNYIPFSSCVSNQYVARVSCC